MLRSLKLTLITAITVLSVLAAIYVALPTLAQSGQTAHRTAVIQVKTPVLGMPSPATIFATESTPPPQIVALAAQAWSQGTHQVIIVSRAAQWLWAFQDGRLAFSTPVATGRPGLVTPAGTFHVQQKVTDLNFISPWPASSPNYYAPEHVNYALYFHDVGYYIHDAPWREHFGPGSNLPQVDPDGNSETGSHGCINVPTSAGAWLYHWATVGATIDVV